MGKYSDFERKDRDFYPTPLEGVVPLIRHLPKSFTYAEPCAGNCALAMHLDYLTNSSCIATWLSDIEPQDDGVEKMDAFDVTVPENTDYIITNPPWNRKILHPMIEHFSAQRPTWLLFDANWMFTKQAEPYLKYCDTIVTVGRLKWIPGTKQTGKEDCCWYLFDKKFIMAGKFGSSQAGFPFNQCEFVFEGRSVTVAYAGTCNQALDQLYKCGRCTKDEIANIIEIREKNLRQA